MPALRINDLEGVTRYDGAPGIVLLAHNCIPFLFLKAGDTVEWDRAEYVVREIYEAQALRPNDEYSDFVFEGQTLTSTELFDRVYQKGSLVLQTCRLKNRIRHFVKAELCPTF